MNFLEKIDNIYSEKKIEMKISEEDTSFCCYIPIKPLDQRTKNKFIVQKGQKSKLLVASGKQRVYISDIQAIITILSLDKDDIRWFLRQLIILYSGNTQEVRFSIKDETFNGYGIELYPTEKTITLFSDTDIDINDFIFVLNFIFSKDKCWEEMKLHYNFVNTTLCKYISLIDYYSNDGGKSEDFLKNIGYPIKWSSPGENRKIKVLFNNTEKFDISLYECYTI